MKIIAFGTLKGGAGKTTNLFNIAGILAENRKVLLIDVDPQCNLTNNCGVDTSDLTIPTVRDIFGNPPVSQPAAEELVKKHLVFGLPNLHLIPSSIQLFETEIELSNKGDREHKLEKFIRNNHEFLSTYDYIMIDTNPSMSIININAFLVADSIVLSSDISANSIIGSELFCALWDRKRADFDKEDNINALIFGNADMRSNLGYELKYYADSYQSSIPYDIIVNTIIPQAIKIKTAELKHQTVNILYPDDKITAAYRSVVDELLKKGVI